jgi:hypothetical protein
MSLKFATYLGLWGVRPRARRTPWFGSPKAFKTDADDGAGCGPGDRPTSGLIRRTSETGHWMPENYFHVLRQDLFGDGQFLYVRSAFVNPADFGVAIELFHRIIFGEANAAENLDRL